ncbi:helix-turn-helix domain-containing protein [Lacisediminimonas profundi]|uniref:helix-turn-helix domain-containing protein n=1 Tax=Lacisediminimonas profundi TaxID=2603856 RepID=UPI00124B6072|nr:helix-turn-helix domain-containing protein [Lacisediminimonas profundi]
MIEQFDMRPNGYDPDNLLGSLIGRLRLKNDAALSRALEVAPPVISKIRHRRLPVGASLLIRMHEVSNLSIEELRELMGDRRGKFRISDKQFKPKLAGPGARADAGSAMAAQQA